MTVCSMTRSKVKVTSPLKSEIQPFSKAISFPIYNGGWQMTTDSLIRAQYLKLIKVGFFIFVLVFLCYVTLKLAVSRSRLSVSYGANFYCSSSILPAMCGLIAVALQLLMWFAGKVVVD